MRDTLSTTEKVFNTYDNRKFSDFKFIIIRWGLGTNVSSLNTRHTAIIDISNWREGSSYTTTCLHGSDSQAATNYNVTTLSITYNNDTSVKAKVGGASVINVFDIIGYKLNN